MSEFGPFEHTVGVEDTALVLGSGSLEVLGTPRMLAWMESATCQAISAELDETSTSLGVRVEVDHLRPSPVGSVVSISGRIESRSDKSVVFSVDAVSLDRPDKPLAAGRITRVIVRTEDFLRRL
ncbi:thioesterase family protein [Mycolicibacterium sp. D5.8-2]|uniref:thioesterase family protein n=1 Tax=Mycolicibacterium sp. D5.8-2 TaxID=3085903 RepID=UPI00298C2A24|nr:hotdog domain-containing protein [Mycolicibacterium sp. D5.8-2]MDW5609744.1 hotdog domain-containing protein [Mycolicibacterium sp. D5.8-2]